MDSLIRLDDVIQDYVMQYNPLFGAIICDYALNVKPRAVRDSFWQADFRGGASHQRSLYSVKQAGRVFWSFFLKYSVPTAQEYFGWVREMLLNIACFERLLGIKAEALRNIDQMIRVMEGIAHFLGYKQWRWETHGGNQYAKDIEKNPTDAFLFILSLYPKSNEHAIIELAKSREAFDLLRILRDCNLEIVGKLRERIAAGQKNGPTFTTSAVYEKCHTAILGPNNQIGGTPNPYLRYPEVYQVAWGDFLDHHTTLKTDHGNGPLLNLLRQVPRETEKAFALNDILFYSKCMPATLEQMISDVIQIRAKDGVAPALEHTNQVSTDLYLTHLRDENIQLYNYNVALALVLSDPTELIHMDVDAGRDAPLQRPTLPKPAKKKDGENTMVFWLIGLGAICLYAIGAF